MYSHYPWSPLTCLPDEKGVEKKEEKIHGMVLSSSDHLMYLMFLYS